MTDNKLDSRTDIDLDLDSKRLLRRQQEQELKRITQTQFMDSHLKETEQVLDLEQDLKRIRQNKQST